LNAEELIFLTLVPKSIIVKFSQLENAPSPISSILFDNTTLNKKLLLENA
jgi:hypothetical protein